MPTAGQGIPGLPFAMQPTLGLGLGSMLASQRAAAGVNRAQECVGRPGNQDQEVTIENGKERSQDKHETLKRESRKRGRSSSLAESDDDVMVLSNSPSSNETNEQRENGPSNVWENPPLSMGLVPNGSLGFSLPNPSLVSNSIYPADPSSFMAAMGSQMPFDVRCLRIHKCMKTTKSFTQLFECLQFGLMGSVMANVQNPTKEPIHFKSCVLFPPNPQAPLPTTRERPLGCRTVFVGGLVENVSGT